jgi:hypothetical protein
VKKLRFIGVGFALFLVSTLVLFPSIPLSSGTYVSCISKPFTINPESFVIIKAFAANSVGREEASVARGTLVNVTFILMTAVFNQTVNWRIDVVEPSLTFYIVVSSSLYLNSSAASGKLIWNEYPFSCTLPIIDGAETGEWHVLASVFAPDGKSLKTAGTVAFIVA